MYEKDGEKYFVVDAHMHFWDASRENWREGREQYAKGWIDCFYGYHQLAPPETHWDYEHYLKVSEEDLVKEQLTAVVRSFSPGDVIHLIIERRGQTKEVPVRLEARPADLGQVVDDARTQPAEAYWTKEFATLLATPM